MAVENKKDKNSKPTRRRASGAKIHSRYKEMRALLSWNAKGNRGDIAEKIRDYLLDEDEKQHFFDIIEFLVWFGMPQATYYEYVRDFPKLKEAHDMIKLRCAVRRERSARLKEQDGAVIMKTLHKYHPTWAEVHAEDESFRERLADKNADPLKGAMRVVEIDRYEIDSGSTDTTE